MKRNNFYYVEDILGQRKVNGEIQYKIKWDGYPIEQSTWEPEENLTGCDRLMKKFKKENKIREKDMKRDIMKKILISGSTVENNEENTNIIESSLVEFEILDNVTFKIPTEIINTKKINETIYYLCKYESNKGRKRKQKNEDKIKPVYVPSSILKETNPKLVIEFLESKIRFFSKK